MISDTEGKFGINPEENKAPVTVNIPNYPKPASEKSANVIRAQKLLNYIKWSLIPLSLIQLLFILPKAYPLLLNSLFPLLGLLGLIKLSSYLLKLFGIYLIILSVSQVILMIIAKGMAYIVLQTIFLLFESFMAFVLFKTANLMDSLPESEFISLKSNS